MEEGASWGSGLVRGARVGFGALTLGARLAGGRYLGLPTDRAGGAARLAAALGGLKGPLMKIGQMLATIPEALPPEYAAALQQLQSAAPPMGRAFVRRRMRTELGPDWRARFAQFFEAAPAAAPPGPGHRAAAPGPRGCGESAVRARADAPPRPGAARAGPRAPPRWVTCGSRRPVGRGRG